jgi:hypothetical protein
MIQAPKPEPRIMRYELSVYEWTAIKPMLPNKPRGVRRVNDRRVLNGIIWVLRSGAPWRDLPENYRQNVLAGAHDPAAQMIDTSIVRVHQHGSSNSVGCRDALRQARSERPGLRPARINTAVAAR